jgi:crotonobetainyl-CoA:carnitine CoA-transferase CaiB-like acyl-CoA transferase
VDIGTREGAGSTQNRVLAGLSVLRLGKSLAGDLLCTILSDAGATILSRADGATLGTESPRVMINDLGRGAPVPDGMDFQSISADRPELVYCSLVSFPANGPKGLPELEDDPILAALGINRPTGGAPEQETLRIPSLYGAQLAAIYIACALMPRNDRGRAQFIEVPLFSAALNILGRQLIAFDDPRLKDPLVANHMLPIFAIRRCADGRYVQPHGRYPNLARTLFRAAGRPQWAEDAANGLENLPDRATVDMWNRRMDEMFLERPAAEWEQIINEANGSCTMCRTHEEWLAEEHPHRSRIFLPAPGERGYRVGPPFIIDPAPQVTDTASPLPAATARPDGARPLEGIRVLDFCIIIAGPTAGRILADLGADVIKIDAPDRVVNPVLWMDVNRGKRSVVLNLASSEGQAIAGRLAQGADVILENFRKGKLATFGLGYADLAKRNPGIVYTSMNLFDQNGPWAQRPGWDHNAQAATGMQLARSRNGAPRHMPLPVNDYGTGLFGALGTVLALLDRERYGRGARVSASLARTASFLQQAHYTGEHARWGSALHLHTFACADGWVTVYLERGQQPPSGEGLDRSTESPAASVLAALVQRGFRAAIESSPAQLAGDPWLDEAGLRVRWTHPQYGPFMQAAPHGTMDGFDLSPRHPAPSPGADNEGVIAELGQGARFREFEDTGVAQTFPLFPEPERAASRPTG